ncbi:helix-turn-helix domain-containing protein [Nocardia xishanensis]
MARRGLLNAALGVEIRARRLEAGLSQQQLWTRAELPKNVYQRLEGGQRTISVEQLDAIAEALETTMDDIAAAAKNRIARGEIRTRAERAADELRAAIGFD